MTRRSSAETSTALLTSDSRWFSSLARSSRVLDQPHDPLRGALGVGQTLHRLFTQARCVHRHQIQVRDDRRQRILQVMHHQGEHLLLETIQLGRFALKAQHRQVASKLRRHQREQADLVVVERRRGTLHQQEAGDLVQPHQRQAQAGPFGRRGRLTRRTQLEEGRQLRLDRGFLRRRSEGSGHQDTPRLFGLEQQRAARGAQQTPGQLHASRESRCFVRRGVQRLSDLD